MSCVLIRFANMKFNYSSVWYEENILHSVMYEQCERTKKQITFKHHLARKCHKAFVCFNKKKSWKKCWKKNQIKLKSLQTSKLNFSRCSHFISGIYSLTWISLFQFYSSFIIFIFSWIWISGEKPEAIKKIASLQI